MLIIASQSSEEHRLILINRKLLKELYFYRDELLFLSIGYTSFSSHPEKIDHERGNDSNLLIVFYVQIMPDDLVMQLHRF